MSAAGHAKHLQKDQTLVFQFLSGPWVNWVGIWGFGLQSDPNLVPNL